MRPSEIHGISRQDHSVLRGRELVSLMVLGVLSLVYIVFRILVKTEDVVKYGEIGVCGDEAFPDKRRELVL